MEQTSSSTSLLIDNSDPYLIRPFRPGCLPALERLWNRFRHILTRRRLEKRKEKLQAARENLGSMLQAFNLRAVELEGTMKETEDRLSDAIKRGDRIKAKSYLTKKKRLVQEKANLYKNIDSLSSWRDIIQTNSDQQLLANNLKGIFREIKSLDANRIVEEAEDTQQDINDASGLMDELNTVMESMHIDPQTVNTTFDEGELEDELNSLFSGPSKSEVVETKKEEEIIPEQKPKPIKNRLVDISGEATTVNKRQQESLFTPVKLE